MSTTHANDIYNIMTYVYIYIYDIVILMLFLFLLCVFLLTYGLTVTSQHPADLSTATARTSSSKSRMIYIDLFVEECVPNDPHTFSEGTWTLHACVKVSPITF